MPRRWLHSFVSLYRFGKTYETLHYDKDKSHRELDYHHREVKHGERIGWLVGTIKKVCDLTNVQLPSRFLENIKEKIRSLPPEDWTEIARKIWEELPEDAQASVLHELMDLEYSSLSQKSKNKIVKDTIGIILSSENCHIDSEEFACNAMLTKWLFFPSIELVLSKDSPVEKIENREVLEEVPSALFFEDVRERITFKPGNFLKMSSGKMLKVVELFTRSPGKSSFLELRDYIRKRLDKKGMEDLV